MTANKDRTRLNGYRPSIYSYSKRKTIKTCDNSKTINENYLRPFILNYITNLAYIQKNFYNIKSLNQLEKELLKGNTFNQIHSIKIESLQKTFRTLSQGKYIPDIDYDETISYYDTSDKYINLLEKERIKSENAISKLIDLYLYNSDSITKKEYIDYAEITIYLDDDILKNFIDQVIDKIYILEGHITKIQFSNGLEHEFIYTLPAERPVCKKCGEHISYVGVEAEPLNIRKTNKKN